MSLAKRWLDDARRKLPDRQPAPPEHHERRTSLKAQIRANAKRPKGNDRA